MAAFKQLLHRTIFSSSSIRSGVGLQGIAYNFPFHCKSLFATVAPPDSPPTVIDSIGDAEQFAASTSETGLDEDHASFLQQRKDSPPTVIDSIADAEQFASAGSEEALSEEDYSPAVKPRVANLPEDLTAEQLSRFATGSGSEDDEAEKGGGEIPYPSFVKTQLSKKRNPTLLADAIREVKANARARFDETIEAHVRLGIDPRRSDQMVRGAGTLPHGSGKVVRVAVFAEGAAAEEAERAGADVIGADELVAEIQDSGGKLNFDKCIATPSFMPKLGKVARILGPRGMMPNPKVGTVTNNVGEAVRAAKQGRVDFRADKTGIVHAGLGKVSFKEEALAENIAAFTGALLAAKPVGLKKTSRYAGYVNSFVIASTMGAGVQVSLQSLVQAADSYSKSVETR